MFNPSITFELKALWDYTSSFYNLMYDSDKEVIEDYWTALLEGLYGLYYDIYQYNLLKTLDYSRGYLENVYKYYDIYLEEDYAEERGRLEEKTIKVHEFEGVLYAITSKRIYKTTDQQRWEDTTLNLYGQTFTCKDITDDGTDLFLLTSIGIYKKETAQWTSAFSTTIFDKISASDSSLSAISNTNSTVYLGDLNYLTEYAFTDLSTKENYNYSGTTFYSTEWVNDYLVVGTDDGLHVYDPNIAQETGAYGEWVSVSDTSEPEHCVSLIADPENDYSVYVGSPTGLYYYTISGAWEEITTDIVVSGQDSIDVLEVDESAIFASTINGIYYAADSESTFTNISTTLQSSQPLALEVYSGILYAGTIDGVYKTTYPTDNWAKFDSGYYYYELPGEDLYLSVPTLSGELTGQVLTEGTDYEVYQMRYLKFYDEFEISNEAILNGERFLSTSDLILAPTLKNIFLPGFGETSPMTLIENGEYPPYLSGVSEDTLTNYEYKQYYADHIMKWTHALSAKLRHAPTVQNLTDVYGYIKGIPFAYEDSWFDSSWSGENSTFAKFVTSGSTDYIVYEIPYPLEYFEYEYGDYVDKYDLIGSGINIVDYVKDLTLISGMLVENGDEVNTLTTKNLMFLQETNRLYLSGVKAKNNDNIIDKFVDEVAPLGLTKLVGNREPQVGLETDLLVYQPSGLAIEVPIDVEDAEDDILTYKLRTVSPTFEYLTSNVLTTTVNDAKTSAPTFVPDQRPPVDTSYRFIVEVDDIYHTVETATRNFVAGDAPFIQWGQPDYGFDHEFAIGDVDIEYVYLSGLINSGISIDFNQPFYIEDEDHHPKDFCVLKDDDDLYHLYFLRNRIVKDPPNPQSNLVGDEQYFGHATSYDLRTWTDQDPILACDDGEDWERTYVWAPDTTRNPFNETEGHALYGLGKYLMLYTGVDNGDPDPGDPGWINQKMGIAFSDDAFTWTRYAGNPVIDPTDWHYDGSPEKWIHYNPSDEDNPWDAVFRDPCIVGPISVSGTDTWYVVNTVEAYINNVSTYQGLSLCSTTDFITWSELGEPLLLRDDSPDTSAHLLESADLFYENGEWQLVFNDGNGANALSNSDLITGWDSPYGTHDLETLGGSSDIYDRELQTIEFYKDTTFGHQYIMAGKRLCTGGPGRGFIAFYGADFTLDDPWQVINNNNFYGAGTSAMENLIALTNSGTIDPTMTWTVYDVSDVTYPEEPTAIFNTLVSGMNPTGDGEYRVIPDGAKWSSVTHLEFSRTDKNGESADDVLLYGDMINEYLAITYDENNDNILINATSYSGYVEHALQALPGLAIGFPDYPEDGVDFTIYKQLSDPVHYNSFNYQPTIGDGPLERNGVSSGMTGNAYIATRERHYTPRYDSSSPTGYNLGSTWDPDDVFGWTKSSTFKIQKNRIGLMVGGGNHPNTEFVALVDAATDRVLFKETGEDSDVMSQRIWDTTLLRGRDVYFVIADLSVETWGFISCDAIHEYTENDPANDAVTPAEPLGESAPLISTLTDITVDLS